jgi:hypothetical protein
LQSCILCCIHNSVSMFLSQVPHTVSVERRAHQSTWRLQHQRCTPPLATLNFEAVLAEHGAVYEHVEECLLKQMSDSALLQCKTHVGMCTLLRGAALAAALMLAVADAATFHGHLVPSGDFIPLLQTACPVFTLWHFVLCLHKVGSKSI